MARQKPRSVLNRKEKLNSYGEKCIPESNQFCILNLEGLGGLSVRCQMVWMLDIRWSGCWTSGGLDTAVEGIRGFSGGLVYIHILTHSELMDISRQ